MSELKYQLIKYINRSGKQTYTHNRGYVINNRCNESHAQHDTVLSAVGWVARRTHLGSIDIKLEGSILLKESGTQHRGSLVS